MIEPRSNNEVSHILGIAHERHRSKKPWSLRLVMFDSPMRRSECLSKERCVFFHYRYRLNRIASVNNDYRERNFFLGLDFSPEYCLRKFDRNDKILSNVINRSLSGWNGYSLRRRLHSKSILRQSMASLHRTCARWTEWKSEYGLRKSSTGITGKVLFVHHWPREYIFSGGFSYKLWYAYLKLRQKQVKQKCIVDPAYEDVNNTFERALVFMHKVRWLSMHLSLYISII